LAGRTEHYNGIWISHSPCPARKRQRVKSVNKGKPPSHAIQLFSTQEVNNAKKKTNCFWFLSSVVCSYYRTQHLCFYIAKTNLDVNYLAKLSLMPYLPCLLEQALAVGFFHEEKFSQWLIRNFIYCLWHWPRGYSIDQCSVS